MFHKKGMMAIGTLIIFIAIILISAIVAGFLIGTTGILQQRSSFVAKETEDRLTSGVEVLSLVANADVENETLNNYEALVRLKAGSDSMNVRYLSLVFTTEDNSYPISLQDDFYSTFDTIALDEVSNDDKTYFMDLDYDGQEEYALVDVVQVNRTYSNGTNYSINQTYFVINFSDDDNINGSFRLLLDDLSNVSVNNSVDVYYQDLPIYIEDRNGRYVRAFLQLDDEVDVNNTIKNVKITEFPVECTFDNLKDYDKFCYAVQLGDNNSVIEKGELFRLRFKLEQFLGTDDLFEFQIVPKTGAIQRLKGFVPSVIVLKQVVLYP